jgi:hypothetical protein
MPFPAAVESQGAAQWLYATLTAHAGLAALVGARVYEGVGPQGSALPYVVYHLVGSSSVPASGGAGRILDDQEWLVQALAEGGSPADADAVALQVDGALSGSTGTATVGAVTYTVMTAQGQESVRYAELHQGRRILHSGRRYRVLIHA